MRRDGIGSTPVCYYLIIMQPETNQPEGYLAPLKKVTPVSKYLAMTLFIILPFLGGWIGYNLAPEKVVEVEKFEFIQEINSNIPANNVQETQAQAFADGVIGIVASTSRYVLKSYECNSRDSQVTASITCFSLEESDGSLIHKNLADVAVSQGFSPRVVLLACIHLNISRNREIKFILERECQNLVLVVG